jgi:hypothetical protein
MLGNIRIRGHEFSLTSNHDEIGHSADPDTCAVANGLRARADRPVVILATNPPGNSQTYPASQGISKTIESQPARINAVGKAARAAAVHPFGRVAPIWAESAAARGGGDQVAPRGIGDAIRNHRMAAVGIEHRADVGVSRSDLLNFSPS